MTDNRLVACLLVGGMAAILVAAVVTFCLVRNPAPAPAASATPAAKTPPAEQPVQPTAQWHREGYHSDDDTGFSIIAIVLGVILIIGLIAVALSPKRSPWHLETRPDGVQVWVREQEESFFIFWW